MQTEWTMTWILTGFHSPLVFWQHGLVLICRRNCCVIGKCLLRSSSIVPPWNRIAPFHSVATSHPKPYQEMAKVKSYIKPKKKKEKKKGPVDFSVQCNTTTTNILSSLAQITNLATVTQQQKQHINMYRIQQRIKVVKVFSLYKIISRKYKNHLHHHKTKIYI